MIKALHGKSEIILPTFDADSFDAVVTDPPYELGFMGKKWDNSGIAFSVDFWKEVFRVMKPGAHLVAFGGTRTYHRMACAIEDAGFEIRDSLHYIYSMGFPKSHNISKAIDRQFGEEREVTRPATAEYKKGTNVTWDNRNSEQPVTPEAHEWNGWGTALKPAHEPIILARKPISEKTVASNVLKHGTGGLNINASRIESNGETTGWGGNGSKGFSGGLESNEPGGRPVQGRFPSNIIFDRAMADVLDEQTGKLTSGKLNSITDRKKENKIFGTFTQANVNEFDSSSGGASRFFKVIEPEIPFFYNSKASTAERNFGVNGEKKQIGTYAQDEWSRNNMGNSPDAKRDPVANFHPTVKPVRLCSWLITLITPPGGLILDPFAGSGTTLLAAKELAMNCIGIEQDAEYIKIIESRISAMPDDLFA